MILCNHHDHNLICCIYIWIASTTLCLTTTSTVMSDSKVFLSCVYTGLSWKHTVFAIILMALTWHLDGWRESLNCHVYDQLSITSLLIKFFNWRSQCMCTQTILLGMNIYFVFHSLLSLTTYIMYRCLWFPCKIWHNVSHKFCHWSYNMWY